MFSTSTRHVGLYVVTRIARIRLPEPATSGAYTVGGAYQAVPSGRKRSLLQAYPVGANRTPARRILADPSGGARRFPGDTTTIRKRGGERLMKQIRNILPDPKQSTCPKF